MTFLLYLTASLLLFVSLVLMLLILIQKGRGGGLAGAFGGGAGGHTAFGSKTGDVLTWATSIVFAVFILLAVAANLVFNHVNNSRRSPATAVRTTATVPPAGSTAPGSAAPGTTSSDKASTPTVPGGPGSSLPEPPLTADPGVQHPPAAPSTQP